MQLFLDASVLVKLYVEEPGSTWLLKVIEKNSPQIYLSALSRAEFHAAVRHRQGKRDIGARDADELLRAFDQDLSSRYVVQPVNSAVIDLCCELVSRHSLPPTDGLQLASCVLLVTHHKHLSPLFLSADAALNSAAENEGIRSDNPESRK